MMTSKSDPRGHPGLELCVHVSVMGYYRFINFHQNRRGSGIFLGDFTWNSEEAKLAKLVQTLVIPHLSYCAPIWGALCKKQCKRLQKVMNRAADW